MSDTPSSLRTVSFIAYAGPVVAISMEAGAAVWWASQINARLASVESQINDLAMQGPGQSVEIARAFTAIAVMEERFRRFDDAIARLDATVRRLEKLEARQ